jgi:hypothetical protein
VTVIFKMTVTFVRRWQSHLPSTHTTHTRDDLSSHPWTRSPVAGTPSPAAFSSDLTGFSVTRINQSLCADDDSRRARVLENLSGLNLQLSLFPFPSTHTTDKRDGRSSHPWIRSPVAETLSFAASTDCAYAISACSLCFDGQWLSAYEQKTQQIPALGRSIAPQLAH